MKKRGISNFVIIFFFIIIVIIAAVLLYTGVKKLFLKPESKITCLTNVDLIIKSACYESGILKISLKNNKETELGEFFKVIINYKDETSEEIPTVPNIIIKALETKEVFVSVQQKEIKNIFVIPKINGVEGKEAFCAENAPEFKPQPC